MTTPENNQNSFSEEVRQNLENSFNERMNKWQEALIELEQIQRPLSKTEKIALTNWKQEIQEILTKPYESDEKKASLQELLAKIQKILNPETV